MSVYIFDYWDRRQKGGRPKRNSTIQIKCVGALERARRADQSTYRVRYLEVRGSKVVTIGVHERDHAHEHDHRRRGTLM